MNISYSYDEQNFYKNPDPNVKYDADTRKISFKLNTVRQILAARGKTRITITLRDRMGASRYYETSFRVTIPEKVRKNITYFDGEF